MCADAVESINCVWLSLVVVIGLAANFFLDAWWVDFRHLAGDRLVRR